MSLDAPADVLVRIYDGRGQQVASLAYGRTIPAREDILAKLAYYGGTDALLTEHDPRGEVLRSTRLSRPGGDRVTCQCMTEDPGDGWGERVITHALSCPLHPEHDTIPSTPEGA